MLNCGKVSSLLKTPAQPHLTSTSNYFQHSSHAPAIVCEVAVLLCSPAWLFCWWYVCFLKKAAITDCHGGFLVSMLTICLLNMSLPWNFTQPTLNHFNILVSRFMAESNQSVSRQINSASLRRLIESENIFLSFQTLSWVSDLFCDACRRVKRTMCLYQNLRLQTF